MVDDFLVGKGNDVNVKDGIEAKPAEAGRFVTLLLLVLTGLLSSILSKYSEHSVA